MNPRILVVEDDPALTDWLRTALGKRGFVVTARATVAEALSGRGIPIIFATGYGEGGVEGAWRGRPTVQKPYTVDDIVRTLASVLAR